MRLARWGLLSACISAFVLAVLVAVQVQASEPKFPPLTDRVVDGAGILSPQASDLITQTLAQHERATGNQIIVVTVKSLQGYPIEDFGYKLGRHWGIGTKQRNNGAILLIAPNERKVRIEVGYGLEDRLTDAQSKVIIEQFIVPAFRSGDFNTGVQSGTAAILQVLGSEHLADARPTQHPRRHHRSSYTVLDLLFLFGIWGTIFILHWLQRKEPHLQRGHGWYLGPGGWYGGGFGGGFSGGGGGGGFLGGGGSFGGGGASGSW